MFMMVSSASNVVFLRSRITLPKDTSMSAPLNTGSSTMCLTELKVVSTDTKPLSVSQLISSLGFRCPKGGWLKGRLCFFVRIESFRFSMMTNPNRINPNGQYTRKKSFVIQFNCGKRKQTPTPTRSIPPTGLRWKIVKMPDTTSSIGQDTSKSNKDGSIIPRFRSKNNIPTMINKVAIRYPFVLFSLKSMS